MSDQTKSAAELAAETKAAVDKAVEQVKAIADEALGKANSGEKLTEAIKEKADEALVGVNGLRAKLAELEQRAAREGGEGEAAKSFGEQFVENEQVKRFLGSEQSSGRVDMRFKATITSATTAAAGSAGAGVANTRLGGILERPRRRLTVRDLLRRAAWMAARWNTCVKPGSPTRPRPSLKARSSPNPTCASIWSTHRPRSSRTG